MTDEFRGLAHVVEAWRDVKENEWMTIEGLRSGGFGRLVDVLEMADQYMTEAEGQQTVNEAAPSWHDMRTPMEFRESGTTDRMYMKYHVTRVDNSDLPGGKHDGCPLFVLDLRHDPHARIAATRWAQSASASGKRGVAADLIELVGQETPRLTADSLVVAEPPTQIVFSPDLAPIKELPEERCGQTQPHIGHEWRNVPFDLVWCVGVRSS